jgi:predicted transcriptional regulator
MTVKETVLDRLQQLPPNVTYDEVLEEVATLAAVERGQQAAAEGRTVPQDAFEKKAQAWTLK